MWLLGELICIDKIGSHLTHLVRRWHLSGSCQQRRLLCAQDAASYSISGCSTSSYRALVVVAPTGTLRIGRVVVSSYLYLVWGIQPGVEALGAASAIVNFERRHAEDCD